MIDVAHALSSFLPNAQVAPVSPVDQPVYILTSDQLRAIISDATKSVLSHISTLEARITALEAKSAVIGAQVEPDRIESLESTVASQSEKIASVEATQDIQADNQLIQLRLINQLREATAKEPENDSPLIDELYKEMTAIGRKQTDFATAARMVKRSKRRMLQLKTAIALDQRFILIPSESHSQKVLIRLREP